jgi:hypothetical protein
MSATGNRKAGIAKPEVNTGARVQHHKIIARWTFNHFFIYF